MFAVLEDTSDKLVIRTGSRNGWNVAVFTLDRRAARVTIERKTMFVARRVVDVAFADLARIDAVTTSVKGRVQHSILVGMQSGKRRWCAGDGPATTEEAAGRMRAFMALRPADARSGNPVSRLYRWGVGGLTAAAVVMSVLVGIGKISRYFILPGCDERPILDTLGELVAPGKGNSIAFSEFRTVSTAHDRTLCQATARLGPDLAIINYATEWSGWSAAVRNYGGKPYEGISDEMAANVKRASETILERAKGADATGDVPSPNDPETAGNLDRLLDTSDVVSSRLKDSDRPKLIDWFNAGHAVGAAYVLAGTGYHEFRDVPQDAGVQAKITRNIVDHAPVVGRYLDFEIDILGLIAALELKLTPSGSVEPKETTERLAPFRSTLLTAIETSLSDIPLDGVADDWRAARLAAIETQLDRVKGFLTRSQVLELHDYIVETQSKTGSETTRTRLNDLQGKLLTGA